MTACGLGCASLSTDVTTSANNTAGCMHARVAPATNVSDVADVGTCTSYTRLPVSPLALDFTRAKAGKRKVTDVIAG